MGLFNSKTNTVDPEIESALKAIKASEKQISDLNQRITALRGQKDALQEKSEAAALLAVSDPSADAAYQKLSAEIEKLNLSGNKLIAAKKAALAGKLKAEQDLHTAASAGRMKTARKLTTAREKAAQELSDAIQVYAKTWAKLVEVNKRLASSHPLGPIGPGSLVESGEVLRLLAAELWKTNPTYPTVPNPIPLLPGARSPTVQGEAEKFPSLLDHIKQANAYVLQKIEAGPLPTLAEQFEASPEFVS